MAVDRAADPDPPDQPTSASNRRMGSHDVPPFGQKDQPWNGDRQAHFHLGRTDAGHRRFAFRDQSPTGDRLVWIDRWRQTRNRDRRS